MERKRRKLTSRRSAPTSATGSRAAAAAARATQTEEEWSQERPRASAAPRCFQSQRPPESLTGSGPQVAAGARGVAPSLRRASPVRRPRPHLLTACPASQSQAWWTFHRLAKPHLCFGPQQQQWSWRDFSLCQLGRPTPTVPTTPSDHRPIHMLMSWHGEAARVPARHNSSLFLGSQMIQSHHRVMVGGALTEAELKRTPHSAVAERLGGSRVL